ncbi:NACHT, LRR and PYD domains-containing protein 3-like [Cottoperca gobio]|uniref:NACHT, LRR and PYD domains-containing protein 3-like n=1 Tax=Cottoperca gobio TaxID=56716 RepID=A0A6J2R0L9_COTGO|nr:NACHT, LRR and PYD domains-containing protein 3-like [Cottoperca gobio]
METEVESFFRQESEEDDEEEKKKFKRPSSSYGSMKSDSDDVMEEEEEGGNEEEGNEEEVADAFQPPFPFVLPEATTHEGTGLQMIRSDSPETLYTMTTQHTKLPGALVIDTRSSDLGDFSEDAEDDADDVLVADSPEPPHPVEPDDTTQMDENSQPGKLHPEQDLPHIFKSIQSVLTGLDWEELIQFKTWFYQWQPGITLQQTMEGDLLDFVDKILEILGQEHSLQHTMSALESVNKKPEADKLRSLCKRALLRFQLKQHLVKKYQVIHEGVIRAGRQNLLDTVYVEPQISTCGYGGVDPSHELRRHPPLPLQVPSADTFVAVNDLFRLPKNDGQPVRTVLTTGIAGVGMSVSVGKFSLDWAEQRANKDLQFVFKVSFRTLWFLRNKEPLSQKMSIMEVIARNYSECKDMKYLEDKDCKFLIIMDSFDCYQAPLDWQNAPEINDNYTKAHPDVLIVNIIRGTLLRGARVWILGRRAAVSQIPSQFIDVVTEIQGFSDEMKDEYLTKRFDNADLAAKIVAHYKLLPSLKMLARHPFVCWMIATVFERCFRYQGYGGEPPRLTPF